jgi:hypothetical protein
MSASTATNAGWTQRQPPPEFVHAWHEEFGELVNPPEVWDHRDGRSALLGREPIGNDDEWRWHITVRHGSIGSHGRIPSWEELVATAHELRPGVVFVVGIPPRSWWINAHPHVVHLWETTDAHLIEQWRRARREDRPT